MGKEQLNVAPSGSSPICCRSWASTSLRKLAAVALAGGLLSGCSSAAKAHRHVDAGNQYFAAEKYQEAVIEYRNALQADPNLAEAHRMLAQTYSRLHDRPQAAREYVRAADLLSHDVDLQLKAASALLELQEFREARARAEAVLREEPSNVSAQLLLGYARAGLQDLTGAVAEIDESLSAHGGDARTYMNLGMLQLAKGASQSAQQAFTTALALAPKSPHAHLAAAQFYWATSRRTEAEAEAKRALELEPASRDGHWLLAAMYIATNRRPQAEAHLKAAAEGTSPAPRFVLADYYLSMGRTEDAQRILARLAAEDKYFAPATRRLALAEQAAGRPARAEALVDEVLARAPRDRAALAMKVRYLLEARNLDEALAQLRSATAETPRWVEAHELLGDTYLAKGDLENAIASFKEVSRLDPSATAAPVQLAGLYVIAGRHDEAIAELGRVLQRQHGDVAARLMLARALAARGDLAAAETELSTLPDAERLGADAQTQLGTVLLGRGRTDAAVRAFNRALEANPDAVEPLAGLVVVSLRARNTAEARRLVEAALSHRPETTDLLLLAARTYAAAGDVFNTERLFGRALDKDPGNLQAHEQFGRFYAAIGRWREAQAQFEMVAARQPRSVYAPMMVAAVLEAQHRTADARAQYEKVLALDPNAAVAANNLAWAYAESGTSLDVALRLARLAATQLTDRPEATDTLGWIYCQTGRPTDAIPLLETSVRLDPARAVYHYHLGIAYQRAGERDRARRAFERALERNPKFESARHALDEVAIASDTSER